MTPRLALALLPLALLTGCGGDGLSREAFVERAEAVCAEANRDLEAEREPETPAQIAPYFEQVLGTADAATRALEQLAADQPDAAELERIFLTPLRGQVDGLKDYLPEVQRAAEQGEQALDALQEPALPQADLPAMRAYGFDACVRTAEA